MRVVWSHPALLHLQDVHAYIGAINPTAADRTGKTINQKVGRRNTASRTARRVAGTRELVARRFVIPYEISADLIVVLAVIHCARHWPKRFVIDE